jgi:P pilus assembly chaperone PapD
MLMFCRKSSIIANFRFILLFFAAITYLKPSFSQDFEVGPAKLNYDCEPGQIQTKTMTIRNHANSKQQFVLISADIKLDTVKNQKATTPNIKSCKDWLTITPSFFDLNPNETKEVKVVMQVPPGESATKGAVIYVSATEEQTALGADVQMKSSIKVRPRIAVKVIQSPRSNTNYSAALSNLKEVTQPQDSVRSFQVKVLNNGDKVLDGKMYLVLSNLETAKEFKEKPQKLTLFPGVSQTMTLHMPKNVPAGKYSLAAILDYGNNSALEAVQMNIEVK